MRYNCNSGNRDLNQFIFLLWTNSIYTGLLFVMPSNKLRVCEAKNRPLCS